MPSTSLSITASDSTLAQKVMDAFKQDPTKFTQNIATNPAALGLSGDSFSYSLTVDGQTSAGQVNGSVASSNDGGAISIPVDSQSQPNSALNGFVAQTTGSMGNVSPVMVNADGSLLINANQQTQKQTSKVTNQPLYTPGASTSSDTALYPSGKPTVTDVNQGQINDCALDAQLASLAQNNPTAITNMIKQSASGGYDVTLYPNGQKTSVHVNQSDIDAIKGATGADHKSDWASVIEAATVKAGQSYANGSDPGAIMGLLTGTRGSDKLTSSLGGSTASIQAALSAGKLVCASASAASGDIIPGHAYSVLSATNGTVTVRNPWGDSIANDGVETMSTADFVSKFDGVQMQ